MTFITDLYKSLDSKQTVFSLAELSGINENYVGNKLNSAIKYLVKNNNLIRLSKGLYALNNNYSRHEFANKFRVPSYISLYTVLFNSGVVFQPHGSIYLLSKRSEIKMLGEIKIVYRNIKDEILLNPLGIKNTNGVYTASIERAICDKIYLDGNEYFDNLGNINWDYLKEINKNVYNDNKTITKWIQENTKQI